MPTRFAYHHTRPMDNGRVPVGIYWGSPLFKPPSEDHSHGADCSDHTFRRSLKIGDTEVLFFVTGL